MSEEDLSKKEQNSTEKDEVPIKSHRKAKVFVILTITIVFAIAVIIGVYVKKNQDFRKQTSTYLDTVNNYITNFEGVAEIAASTPRYGLTAVIMRMNDIKTKLNSVQPPFSGLNYLKAVYTAYVNETIEGYQTFLGAGSTEFDFERSAEEEAARGKIKLANTNLAMYKQTVTKIKNIIDKSNVFVPISTLKKKIILILPQVAY